MSIFKDTFRRYVRDQISLREELIDLGNTNETTGKISNRFARNRELELQSGTKIKNLDAGAFYTYTTNRNCVIRMTSLVDYVDDVGLEIGGLQGQKSFDRLKGATLSQNFILQGGILSDFARNVTSKGKTRRDVRNIAEVRQGFRKPSLETNLAYGDLAIGADASDDGYGIVPMPGITDANIRTKSAYGSLREAKVTFEVHNKRQLEVMEMLYMRPGYMVLLEWGWCPYVNNKGKIQSSLRLVENASNGRIYTNNITQQEIHNHINVLKDTQSGNYDGLLAIVKNFGFQARPDGGYNCFTELISIGEVMDSLKIPNISIFNTGIGGSFEDELQGSNDKDIANNSSNITIKANNYSRAEIGESQYKNALNAGIIPSANGLLGMVQGLQNYVTFNAGVLAGWEDKNVSSNEDNPTYIDRQLNARFPDLDESNFVDEEDLEARDNRISNISKAADEDAGYGAFTNNNNLRIKMYLRDLLRFQAASVDIYLKQVLGVKSDEELKNYIISRGGDAFEKGDGTFKRKREIQQAFIRWDALVILMNEALVPKTEKALAPFSLVTDRVYYTDNSTRRLDPLLYAPITAYDNIQSNNIFDFSCDGNVCILPNQLSVAITDQGSTIDTAAIEETLGYIPSLETIPIDYIQAKYQANNISYKGSTVNPNSFKLTETDKYRRIGNIFLNIDMLLDIAEKNSDNDDYTLGNFINDIWEQVNKVCPNHNFVLTDDKEANVGFIIDLPVDNSELPVSDLHQFIPFSNKNILREFDYTSNVPSSMTSTIAIQAQDPRSIQDIDGVTFAAFNRAIKNRILSTDTKPNPTKTTQDLQSEKSTLKQEQRDLKTRLKIYLINFFRNLKLSANEEEIIGEGNIMGTLKQYQKNATYFSGAFTNESSFNAVIPLEFTAQLDGISGIVIGNVFTIKSDRLPKTYAKTNIGFIVFNEEQKITAGGDWVTDISGKMIILPTPKSQVKISGVDVKLEIPENLQDFATDTTEVDSDSESTNLEGQNRPTDISAVEIDDPVYLKQVYLTGTDDEPRIYITPDGSGNDYFSDKTVGFSSVRTSPEVDADDNLIGLFNSFEKPGQTGPFNSEGFATQQLGVVLDKEIIRYGDNKVKILSSAKKQYIHPDWYDVLKDKSLVFTYDKIEEKDGEEYYVITSGKSNFPKVDGRGETPTGTVILPTFPGNEDFPGFDASATGGTDQSDDFILLNEGTVDEKKLVGYNIPRYIRKTDCRDEKHIWFRISFSKEASDAFVNGAQVDFVNNWFGDDYVRVIEAGAGSQYADQALSSSENLQDYSVNNECWMRDDVLAGTAEQAALPAKPLDGKTAGKTTAEPDPDTTP